MPFCFHRRTRRRPLTKISLRNQKPRLFQCLTLRCIHFFPLLDDLVSHTFFSLLFFCGCGEEGNSLFCSYPLTRNLVSILTAKGMHSFLIFYTNILLKSLMFYSNLSFIIRKENIFFFFVLLRYFQV